MKNLSSILVILLVVSCSQINQESQEHHNAKKTQKYMFPHGLKKVVIQTEDLDKQIQIDLKASNRGEALYQKNCLPCHGAMGHGDGELADKLDIYPRDLTMLIKSTPNFKFYLDISKWQGDMPGWWWSQKEITSQDLEDITHYLRLLAVKDS